MQRHSQTHTLVQFWIMLIWSCQLSANAQDEIINAALDPTIAGFLRFSEPGFSELELVPGKPKLVLKDWTPAEQKEVNLILLTLAGKSKGLMALAASDGPLTICRVDHLSAGDAAATANGYLFVCDSFFSRTNKLHILVHELIHAADFGGRICYSKGWAKFANSKIDKARQQFKKETLTRRRLPVWPSISATQDLSEALAEYVSDYICGENYKFDPRVVKRACVPILDPDKTQMNFTRAFHRGITLFFKRHFLAAIEQFEIAETIDPLAPKPHACLAQCYFYLGDSQRDYSQSENAIRLFKEASVPESEFDMKPRG